MKIKQAVNRIFWRFGGNGNKKPFPVNDEDVQAYNSIKDYVAQKEKQQFIDQEAFAKLFIYLYQKILENDKSTVLDNNARRKITKFLEKPLSRIIQDFTDSLNESERYAFIEEFTHIDVHKLSVEECEARGVKIGSYLDRSKPITEEDTKKFTEALKTPENRLKLEGKVWEYDFVAECLESEVNQVLNLINDPR